MLGTATPRAVLSAAAASALLLVWSRQWAALGAHELGWGSYHALHAMGKEQDDAVLPDPLGLSRTDELVDYALSGVVEVPELGFPKHQGVGAGHGKAQLKS